MANLQCNEDSHFSLDECSRDDVVFTGGCETTEAGWVECSETGVNNRMIDKGTGTTGGYSQVLGECPGIIFKHELISGVRERV